MKTIRLSRLACATLACTALAVGASAQATEWPLFRQNSQHTGSAPGEGALTNPAVRARVYLGGAIGGYALLAQDVNDDGEVEVAMVVSGKVILKDLQDRVLWDTFVIRATQIMGAYDFDGDGSTELLVLGQDGLYILRGRDGEVLWHKTGFMTNANSTDVVNTRVVDLNDDGLLEIVVKPFYFSDDLIHAYTFAAGFNATNPEANKLWQHNIYEFNAGNYPVIGDVNLDGFPDVATSEYRVFEIFNGANGSAPTYIYNTDHAVFYGRTQIINIDDDPQPEIVHYTQADSKAIEVFDVRTNTQTPTVQVIFPTSNFIYTPTDAVGDFDGDGVFELMLNRWDGSNWRGMVYQYREDPITRSKATLLPVVELVDHYISGFVDLDGDGKRELLSRDTRAGQFAINPFTTLRVYGYNNGLLTPRWQLQGASWQTVVDRGTASLNPTNTLGNLAAQDVDGDGRMEVYATVDADGDLLSDRMVILNGEGFAPTEVARYPMAPGERFGVIWLTGDSGVGARGDSLMFDSSGVLLYMNAALQIQGNVKVGGFFNRNPTLADLDNDGVNELLIGNSSSALRAYDPTELDQSSLPEPVFWTYEGQASQFELSADFEGDGSREYVVRNNLLPTQPKLELLDSDGLVIETLTLPTLPYNLNVGDFVGTSTLDVFGARTGTDGQTYTFVVDGDTWSVAWEVKAPYTNYILDDQSTTQLDADGDGDNDIAFGQDQNMCVVNGQSGAVIKCSQNRLYSGGVIAAQLDADAESDLVIITTEKVEKLTAQLASDWKVTGPPGVTWPVGTLNRDGSVVDTDGDGLAEIYVTGVDTLYRIDPDGSVAWFQALSGGAESEGGSTNRLGAVATGDIDGDGQIEAVVGSSDGYLYALDCETGELEWSFGFFYSLGSPILADADGDNLLDIAVTVAEGYLYILTPASLPAPAEVRDVAVGPDGKPLNPGTDVEQTEVVDRLGAAWTPVTGAAGYMVAVISDHNTYVVEWTDVGSSTSVVITDSRLVYGHRYRVIVQAYKADRSGSPWAFSNGVEIIDVTPPTVTQVHAEPSPFDPDLVTTTLIAELADLTGVVSFSVTVTGTPGTVFSYAQGAASTQMTARVPWDGRVDGVRVPDGTYEVVFTTTDYGGHTATGRGEVIVQANTGTPTPPPTPTPEPSPSPSPEPSPSPSPEPSPSPSPEPSLPPGDDDTTESPTPNATPTPEVSPTPGDSPTPDESPTPEDSPTPGDDDDSSPGDDDDASPGDDDDASPGDDDDSSPGDDDDASPGDDDDSSPGDDDDTSPGDDDDGDPGDDDATGGGDDSGDGCDCAIKPGRAPGSRAPAYGGYAGLLVLAFSSWISRRRR